MGPRKRAKPNPATTAAVAAGEASPPASQPPTMPSQSTADSQASKDSDSTSTSTPWPSNLSATPATSQPPSQTDRLDTTGASTPKVAKENRNGPSTSPSKQSTPSQVHKTRSWYGSWPRVPKSSASTQVARETIQGGTLRSKKAADFSKYDTKKHADAASVDGATATSTPLPNIAENGTSTPTVTSQDGTAEASSQKNGPANGQTDAPKPVDDSEVVKADNVKDTTTAPVETSQPQPPAVESPQRPTTSSGSTGWLGWYWKPATENPAEPAAKPANREAATLPKEMDVDEPPVAAVAEPTTEPPATTEPPSTDASQAQQGQQVAAAAAGARSSWFGFWSTNATAPAQTAKPSEPAVEPDKPAEVTREPDDVVMNDAPPVEEASKPSVKEPMPKAGSTWAFWSRDTGSKSSGKQVAQEQGQLAVIGESSETQPKRSNSIEIKGGRPKEQPLKPASGDESPSKPGTSPAKESILSKKSKRLRPQSMDLDETSSPSRPSTPKPEATPTATPKPESSTKPTHQKTPSTTKPVTPNLLLPSFRSTYRLKDNPSILSQIAQLLLRTQQQPANHVFLAKEPPKIRKALAIGVHGLFPANYLRPMIGQPTGTSIKFANHAAEAVRRWADAHGCADCEIEKVALEGEGRIGERVENLWKLLLNWMDQIRGADLILLACHSQGVPVSIMLLAKLLRLGVITSATRVGVCAMAGVSLGPFPDYRSGMGILMGSAAELWEFSNPMSDIARQLEKSFRVVLDHGARVTLVGSIDDQLVPMESAIYSPAHHPYIYRSVFIDGRIHAPDFIAHLVGFALKLRNLGVTDHGLVRELSLPLAGSLYSGEGHSRLYDDEQVYDLAVSHALETTDLVNPPPCEIRKYEGLAQPNPYHLPWIMRGLLEEDFVKTELNEETGELLRQFDDWKPVNKALKDVKYRLEAVRSKL